MRKLTLSYQLKIGVLITPILLIIAITIYSGIHHIKNINNSKAAASSRIAQSVSEKIDRNFYERYGDVQAFATNYYAVEASVNDTVSAKAQKFINTMINYYVLYDLMIIVDQNGIVKACNTVSKDGKPLQTQFLIGQNFSGEEWFRKSRTLGSDQGGAYYSDFEINEYVKKIHNNEGKGMAFAAPIYNEEGKLTGAWYNFASWKEITEGIREEALLSLKQSEPKAEIILINSKNEIIDATNKDLVANYVFPFVNNLPDDFSFMAGDTKITHKDYISGVYNSMGAYTYKGKNWKVIAFLPKLNYSISNFISWDMLLLDIIFLVIALFIASYFSNYLIKKITILKDFIIRLSKGNLDKTELAMNQNDEIGHIAESLVILRNGLEKTAVFANEVGKGNFTAEFVPLSNDDVLGNSLLKMRENLYKASDEEQKRTWATEGIARFSELIRKENTTKGLAENVLREIIQYLGLNQGALFMATTEKEDIELDLIACIAYNRKKFLSSRLGLECSLPGRAYLEGETIILTEIPKDYIHITSGLGETTPSFLILIPLKNNEHKVGVIEVASFSRLPDYKITFLEKIGETIASAISSISLNEQTKRLLEESQIREEELKAQEEEIRQNMEELQATQEEMYRKEREYEIVISDLKNKL